MPMDIRAAVCAGNGAPPVIESLILDDPAPDELIIKVEAAGVCHTDIGIAGWSQEPRVYGHEGAGIVIATSSAVTRFKAGDRVLASFGLCGHCPNCEGGRPAYCFDGIALNIEGQRQHGPALRGPDGSTIGGAFFQQSSFATHALVTERNLVAIPDALNFVRAAPLGCGVQTGAGSVFNCLGAKEGRPLVIIGCGAVGLSAVMAGKLIGAEPIIAIDLVAERLAMAQEMGAHAIIDGKSTAIAAQVHALTKGGATAVLDTAGSQQTFETALACLHSGGTLGVLTLPGAFDAPVPHPGGLAFMTTSVVGIIEGDSQPDILIPRLIDEHLAGRLPHDRMIETFAFEDIASAFAASQSGSVIKPVLTFSGTNDT
jgi:aryl-alcohol dehydrogenase